MATENNPQHSDLVITETGRSYKCPPSELARKCADLPIANARQLIRGATAENVRVIGIPTNVAAVKFDLTNLAAGKGCCVMRP